MDYWNIFLLFAHNYGIIYPVCFAGATAVIYWLERRPSTPAMDNDLPDGEEKSPFIPST